MAIVVRRIRADEAEVLRSIRLAALADSPDAFGSTLERELDFTDDVWQARSAESSTSARSATFLAWNADEPIGIVGGHDEGHVVELVSMWTAPAARRSGVGRQLVEATVAWAATLEVDAVELWVMRGNDAAHQLYESMGFEVTVDHQPRPHDPCRDEVRMAFRFTDRATS
jgi:GNAT superfamily N-acetyltransferase